MKHELHRLRPVFAGDRFAGALLHTVKDWDCHDAGGTRIGTFPEDKINQAIGELRSLASRST